MCRGDASKLSPLCAVISCVNEVLRASKRAASLHYARREELVGLRRRRTNAAGLYHKQKPCSAYTSMLVCGHAAGCGQA